MLILCFSLPLTHLVHWPQSIPRFTVRVSQRINMVACRCGWSGRVSELICQALEVVRIGLVGTPASFLMWDVG